MFLGDYWSTHDITAGNHSRLILNKQCGGLQLLSMLRKIILQKPDAVSTASQNIMHKCLLRVIEFIKKKVEVELGGFA